MSFDVPIDLVTTASSEMGSAVEQVKDLDAGTALSTVSGALPGASSASAATAWATQWAGDLADWRSGAKTYSDLLKACVDNYVASDEAAALRTQGMLEQLAGGS